MVAYVREGKIVISHLDGSGARVVSVSGPDIGVYYPHWSPDGTRLLYTWIDYAHPCEEQDVKAAQLLGLMPPGQLLQSCWKTAIYHLATGESRTIPWVAWGAWSPDGEYIAGVSGLEGWLAVIDLSGTRIVSWSALRPSVLTARSSPQHYAWSPDGQCIVYAASEPTLPDQGRIMQLSQANTEIVLEAANSEHYVWSPDSHQLAYFKVQVRCEGCSCADLYIHTYSLDTGEDRVLAQLELPYKVYEWPTWSPDGRHLALSIPMHWEGSLKTPTYSNNLVIIDTNTGEYTTYEYFQDTVMWQRWSEDSRTVYISGRSEILEVTLPGD